MGDYFMGKLRQMNSPHVDHIRGKGLLIGVVVKDASGPARPFCEKLMEEGILAKETHHQVIRFAPPLVITKEEVDWALQRIAKVLGGSWRKPRMPYRQLFRVVEHKLSALPRSASPCKPCAPPPN